MTGLVVAAQSLLHQHTKIISGLLNGNLGANCMQDVKQAQQEAKIAQLEAAVFAVLRVSEGIRDDLKKAGITAESSDQRRKAGMGGFRRRRD